MLKAFLVEKTTLFAFAAVIWVLGAVTCGIYGVQLLNEGSDLQGMQLVNSITISLTNSITPSRINSLNLLIYSRTIS